MASYYYLMSSLPDLRSDGQMPVSYPEFLGMCQSNVSDSVFEKLENLTLDSTEGPVVKEWAAFYGSLTKEINNQRSINMGKTYTTPYEKDSITAQVAAAALAAANPLEAEQILLDYEFDMLDSLAGMHMLDEHNLFAYAIKLKLLERQNCFEHSKGKKEFGRLFDLVQQRVYSL